MYICTAPKGKRFIVFVKLTKTNVNLSCFKQLPLNSKKNLSLVFNNFGARLLLDVAGDLMTSLDNSLDSHDEM